ncbi:uncharacterized protein LOC121868803 [Homarus americanus]|uniref:uncharacterized protein LOC121868803 n=1 Tax=Homarus americanus TaxID=6706 RepID=UPI001C461305|nr:uncharacterized protein LOC121868803 [Homarus americanus]XP_042225683.1 uncharacterized protein LOC121868803 [Homarus americanus]XP_042225684.1 uncharacterized protein LOC121868803 [Homarus americanus]XP_042225685.1 uncharacterized protein LOC121868803 [Homarus americanus]
MESRITDLILCTVPDNLKDEGSKLIERSKTLEETRLKSRSSKFRRHSSGTFDESAQIVESQEAITQRKTKAEEAALPIALAKLIMEFWSPNMRRHAEKLILQKAVQEQYLKEDHLKWVHVLEKPENDESSDSGWLISDQDDAIIELIWNIFNIEEHYNQVNSHRMWIQRSYDRLKDFLPNLPAEIIERHDLSKFPFSQAIGYTLKWVHNIYHDIWKTACDLHLNNEPHHPQTWSKVYAPEEKKKKLEHWLEGVCDFHSGCPYGLDITNLDLNSVDMPEPFLLESFIDMIGVEWERKKGKELDITTRELVYIEDKFLQRYSKKQAQIIKDLMEKVIAADDSWKSIVLTEREKMLLTTIPQHKRAFFVCQADLQKKSEEKRVFKNTQKERKNKYEETVNVIDIMTEEIKNKAHDTAFFIMISKVVTEYWESNFRKYAQDIILKKAIEEKFITDSHLKWILIFDNKVEEKGNVTTHALSDKAINDKALLQLLWVDFKIRDHFSHVQAHRHWIKQSYLRLARFMPELSEEVIERHDLTKFSLSQSLGYTLKWVHDINYSVWRKSCDRHLNFEPHHPQMWSKKHSAETKQSCLESWLCVKAGGSKYGVEITSLDLVSEDMAKVFLLESLVDMVAVEWERNKGKRLDLTYTELIYMEDRFLSRYSVNNKAFILNLMESIRNADHE